MKIALIGLDGSGKSANIDIMKQDKDYSNFKFLWVRWQPSITVFLYKLKHRNDSVGERKSNHQAQKKYDSLNKSYMHKKKIKNTVFGLPFVRRLWMAFAIKDYKRQFYKKTKNYDLENDRIIFDRYFLDLFVDQGINFNYTPEQILKEIQKYKDKFPIIDKTIYIRVSPKVCYQRKDDIPNMEYLEYRYKIYEYLAKELLWTIVDGEKDLATVNSGIKNNILGLEER